MVLQAAFEHPVSSGLGPAEARPIAAGEEILDVKSGPVTEIGDPSCRRGAMVSCGRACAAVETMSSLARKGHQQQSMTLFGGPSVVSAKSEGLVEKQRRLSGQSWARAS